MMSRLDSDNYKVIHDVILETKSGTSQIDHVVVSNYGIFVIETKNYKGQIYGKEKEKYWTQVIYKRKEKLYNPIRQNYGHVKALQEKLGEGQDVPFIPIVVFSINCELKVDTSSYVIHSVNLLKTIRKYEKEIISDDKRDRIYSQIISHNKKSKEVKKQHVKSIRSSKQGKEKIKAQGVCPQCGGNLVVRTGKHGIFQGCSNFPKCRFTSSE